MLSDLNQILSSMSEQIKRPSWLRKKGETVQTDSLETDLGSAKDLYEKGW